MENMIRTYVGACEGLLAEAELELLRAVSERGLTILRERQVGTSKDGS